MCMLYDHHNYLMKRTVQARAQESKEDDQRAARQGCKGSRMLLHPGDDDDGDDDDGDDDDDDDEEDDDNEVEDDDLDNDDADHTQNTPW